MIVLVNFILLKVSNKMFFKEKKTLLYSSLMQYKISFVAFVIKNKHPDPPQSADHPICSTDNHCRLRL